MSVKFFPATCPKCGGELRVPNNIDVVKCMYCGAELILHDSTKMRIEKIVDVRKYSEIAKRAADLGNYEEAYRYASIVLEQEPLNRVALIMKGFTAGMLSTPNNMRYPEAVEYLALGIGDKGPWGKKKDVREITSEPELDYETKKIAYGYCINTAEHLTSIVSDLPFIDGNFEIDLEQWSPCQYASLSLYVMAYKIFHNEEEWKGIYPPRDTLFFTISMKLISALATIHTWQIINSRRYPAGKETYYEVAIIYVQMREQVLSGTAILDDPRIKKKFIDIKNDIEDTRVRELKSPKKNEENCFIATATMGNYNHPYVLVLRDYRDRILLNTKMGRLFTNLYYFLSPPLAKVISKNIKLRFVLHRWLVLPLYKKAVFALNKNKTVS